MVGGRVFHFTKKSHAKIQPIIKLPYSNIVHGIGTLNAWYARLGVFPSSIMPYTRCANLGLKFDEIESEFTGNFAKKPTAPGVPRRSPIQVLSWPDDA